MILNNLLNLFFPKLCVICNNPLIEDEEQVCLSCICDLPHTNFHVQEDNPVVNLFAAEPTVLNATALLYYEKGGKVQRLIHNFKYHGSRELALQLGRQMALNLQNETLYRDVDLLIPVPLHKKRKRKRGYNQSEYLCRGLASIWEKPIETNVLFRESSSDTQTRKSFYDRWLNVKEIFIVKNETQLINKHILLVDDVITSGSTLSACIQALSNIQNIRISILALAVTLS